MLVSHAGGQNLSCWTSPRASMPRFCTLKQRNSFCFYLLSRLRRQKHLRSCFLRSYGLIAFNKPGIHPPSCREIRNAMNLTHYCGCSLSWKSPSGCIQLSCGGVILSEKTSCAGTEQTSFEVREIPTFNQQEEPRARAARPCCGPEGIKQGGCGATSTDDLQRELGRYRFWPRML